MRTTERNESSRVQFYTIYRGRTYSVFGFISEYPPPPTHTAPRGAPPSERLRTARGRSAHSPHMRHGSMHGSAPQGLGGHWRVAAGRGTARRGRRAARDREEYCILFLKKRFYTRTSHPPKYAPAHIPHIPAHRSYPHARTHSRGQPHTHTVPLNTPCTHQKRRIDNMISAQWSLPVAGEGSSLRPPD